MGFLCLFFGIWDSVKGLKEGTIATGDLANTSGTLADAGFASLGAVERSSDVGPKAAEDLANTRGAVVVAGYVSLGAASNGVFAKTDLMMVVFAALLAAFVFAAWMGLPSDLVVACPAAAMPLVGCVRFAYAA